MSESFFNPWANFDIGGISKPKSSWDYPTFREKLLDIAKNPKNVPSEQNFPHKIFLSPDWHDILDKIRTHTKDGRERFALIGYRNNRASLIVQTNPAIGSERAVSDEIIHREMEKAKKTASLEGFLGDIHSHPVHYDTDKLDAGEFEISFSCTDLYFIVNKHNHDYVLVLVNGNYNLFVFRTKETEDLPAFLSLESFEKIWKDNSPLGFVTNLDIAKRHHLVFYKGRTGEPIYRSSTLFDTARWFDGFTF